MEALQTEILKEEAKQKTAAAALAMERAKREGKRKKEERDTKIKTNNQNAKFRHPWVPDPI